MIQHKDWVAIQPSNASGWLVVAHAYDLSDVGSGDGGFSEEAARLMASAPKLLKQLILARETIARVPRYFCYGTEILRDIDEAIAEATGEKK